MNMVGPPPPSPPPKNIVPEDSPNFRRLPITPAPRRFIPPKIINLVEGNIGGPPTQYFGEQPMIPVDRPKRIEEGQGRNIIGTPLKNVKKAEAAAAKAAEAEAAAKKGSGRSSGRAAIVNNVMSEMGMGLIEASRYVKANNLY